MKNSNLLIAQVFATANMYLQNVSEPSEIQKKMTASGLNPKRIQEGTSLTNYAKLLHTQKLEKYGQKNILSSHLKDNEQQARQVFMDQVAIVKFAFRKDVLGLSEFNIDRISKKINEWPLQASYFYLKAAGHAELLAQHGLSTEELAQGQAMVEAVATARNQRMMRKGEAEEATRMRDQSIKELKAWMHDFRAIARVALRDSPQLMESLGMVVKARV